MRTIALNFSFWVLLNGCRIGEARSDVPIEIHYYCGWRSAYLDDDYASGTYLNDFLDEDIVI